MIKSILLFIQAIILIISLNDCSPKKQPIPEISLLGEWYTVKGDVEAYSFLKDDTSFIFTGTLGMRPFIYGKWKIQKDKFLLMTGNGSMKTYSFSLSNDTLIFNDGEEIYTRTAPIELQFPEVRILRDLKSVLGLDFSGPRPADISWGEWADGKLSSAEFTLKGYSISIGSTLSSGIITDISDFLSNSGFERDTLFATEKCNGFRDDNQLVTVCTSRDPESENDSVYVSVSSGFIPR